MVDHRVTDLSYGHLGEVTYDIDTEEWRFSVEPFARNIIQQLPLKLSISPSIQTFPSTSIPSQERAASTKLLVKSRPETFPAFPLISAYSGASVPPVPHAGQMLAIGKAVDEAAIFGSKKTSIIATACGEAGHVLRLIKPRIERHEWGMQSSVRLSALDAASSDQGYWVGTGGRILQVTFAETEKVPTTRLAVRQANAITLFRPLYGANTTPAVAPNSFSKTYPASRINVNPIAVLTTDMLDSREHADITWNPWYSRQFAVIDDCGSWSIWDIEGGARRATAARLIAGKRGNIYDGFVPDRKLKPPDNADGWHKILWAGTVGTIVLCNRRHLTIFDIKSAPTRVLSKELFSARNTDWIFDLQRSPSNPSHLFVLTSSRIFWLAIPSSGEEKDGNMGYEIMLSYRHFRDANDATMRLAILEGQEVMVAIFSEKTALLNVYSFSTSSDGSGRTGSQASLILSSDPEDQKSGNQIQLQSLAFLSTSLQAIKNRSPGPEHQYLTENVQFYQMLVASPDLGLRSGLCSLRHSSSDSIRIIPPTRTYSHTPGYMSSNHVPDENWIVPDGRVDETMNPLGNSLLSGKLPVRCWKKNDDPRFTINFTPIFEQAFDRDESADVDESLKELLEITLDQVNQAKERDSLALATVLELSEIPGFTEDLEQGAPILREFLVSVGAGEETEGSSTLILSNLTLCPGFDFQSLQGSPLPDLLAVYNQVAENWIVSLPLRVPGMTRLAKFKIARKLAVELCLSSIGMSLRSKATEVPSLPVSSDREMSGLLHRSAAVSRAGSPIFSSQPPSSSLPASGYGLPTPEPTPSLYSQSHVIGSETVDDPAISRLRQFAVSITSKSDLGTSKILSHWPVMPGVDPATFSYEASQKTLAGEDSGEETDHRKREQARRRRRTERFLSRQSTAPAEPPFSQPGFAAFGSQPDAAYSGFSSQTVDDVPMTQPDRGAFGSRAPKSIKAKAKKKKVAGFR